MRDLDGFRVLDTAKRLARLTYALCERLPTTERYALSDQLRRAAVSVAANIGEGIGRGSPGDLERFLRIASGSAAELAVLLDLARDIHGVTDPATADAVEHARRQLTLLTQRVHATRTSEP